MGGSSSKPAPVAPEPISTTTTVPTTIHTTAHTPADDLRAAEVRCWINTSHEILFMALAFLSGILLTVLVFAIISLFRKTCKRPHQNLQEEVFSQMAAEDCARSPQNEVTYSTLVFQRGRTPLAV
ncbi:transmembrane protein C1orf162 homolog isoform X1 [Corvus cornix cornix]|uniref:transmembrane protein C1orf162 homolog isoform X1 n=1 Tax=Corvus cornix cornix TaxID=932674 RepID=UPI000900F03C|nr:transmembrane protein C1orf162 homolog isoform X1 [Corvus cornix cornix]